HGARRSAPGSLPEGGVAMPEITPTPTPLSEQWSTDPRWRGLRRDYTDGEVLRLRPSVLVEHTLARGGGGGRVGALARGGGAPGRATPAGGALRCGPRVWSSPPWPGWGRSGCGGCWPSATTC